jgi:hypothetical protein
VDIGVQTKPCVTYRKTSLKITNCGDDTYGKRRASSIVVVWVMQESEQWFCTIIQHIELRVRAHE